MKKSLSKEDADGLRFLRDSGWKISELAILYNISIATVQMVVNRMGAYREETEQGSVGERS